MTGDKIYKKVKAQVRTLEALKEHIVISGGLMIHLLSEPGHLETHYGHDHSDIDLFVIHKDFFIQAKELKLGRIYSKYNANDFHRYHKTMEIENTRVKVLIDAFIKFDIHYIAICLWAIDC